MCRGSSFFFEFCLNNKECYHRASPEPLVMGKEVKSKAIGKESKGKGKSKEDGKHQLTVEEVRRRKEAFFAGAKKPSTDKASSCMTPEIKTPSNPSILEISSGIKRRSNVNEELSADRTSMKLIAIPGNKRKAEHVIEVKDDGSSDEDLPLCLKLNAPSSSSGSVATNGSECSKRKKEDVVACKVDVVSTTPPAPATRTPNSGGVAQSKMQQAWTNLQDIFKLGSFRPLQREAIEGVLKGRDVIVCLATGGGKSLCYQLPATVLPGVTLVVSPLIALMEDQVKSCRDKGIEAVLLNSTLSQKETAAIYARLCPSLTTKTKGSSLAFTAAADSSTRPPAIKLLYVTPEAMSSESSRPYLAHLQKEGMVSLVAVDEAHCISSWGHDFRPAFRRLDRIKTNFPSVPIIALTATATQRVREDISTTLRLKSPQSLVATFNRPNITYQIRYKRHLPNEDAQQDIVAFLRSRAQQCGIIYCHKKVDCEEIAHCLKMKGYSAACYHGGMSAETRTRLLLDWTNNTVRVIVATIAFGMGIDKADVRFVIHYTVPKSMEGFYQESGRAGRDGGMSVSVVYYGVEDKQTHQYLMNKQEEESQQKQREQQRASEGSGATLNKGHADINRARTASFEALIHMCETAKCRRNAILAFFGETSTGGVDVCKGTCDVCQNPAKVSAAVADLERNSGYGGEGYAHFHSAARTFGPGEDFEVGGRAADSTRAGLYCSDEDEKAGSVSTRRSSENAKRIATSKIADETNSIRRRLMKKTHGLSDSDDEEEEEEEEGSAETRGMGSGYKSTFGKLPGLQKSSKTASFGLDNALGGFTRASDLVGRGKTGSASSGGLGSSGGRSGGSSGGSSGGLSVSALAEIQRRTVGVVSGDGSSGRPNQNGGSLKFVGSTVTAFVPPAKLSISRIEAAENIAARAQQLSLQTRR